MRSRMMGCEENRKVVCSVRREIQQEVLGVWRGRVLSLGMSKQGSMLQKERSAAKGSKKSRGKGRGEEKMALEGEKDSKRRISSGKKRERCHELPPQEYD